MHLKRYRSATVRDALALAREELGPTALVLGTRLVPARGLLGWMGQRVVEVTAAADRPLSENRPAGEPRRPVAPTGDAGVEPARVVIDRTREALIAKLRATGLDAALADQVAGVLPRMRRRHASEATVRRAIADCLAHIAAADESYAPVEVFVGPPGAGKTTTIAKIAARERARRGTKLTLVAADGYRVGAVEQLRLYADIIGSPLVVARSTTELAQALDGSRGPVLVDTAGRSPHDSEAQDLLALVGGRSGTRTHLVVPASTSHRELPRLLARYEAAAPTRVALTKVDEVGSVGPLVAAIREHHLTVSYLGTGQHVPEDLERATPAALAAHVLGDLATGERR